MTTTPTARLFRAGERADLVLTRTFRATASDVWASITEPERTARWFGPWQGDGRPGGTVTVRLAFEDGEPPMELRIDACDPPYRLAVSTQDESGTWRLEAQLSESDGVTELSLVHHLDSTDGIGEIGPGWEYYLDLLVAARNGSPQPGFDEYYPALTPFFTALAAE